jgi:dolichol kinase
MVFETVLVCTVCQDCRAFIVAFIINKRKKLVQKVTPSLTKHLQKYMKKHKKNARNFIILYLFMTLNFNFMLGLFSKTCWAYQSVSV